MANRAYLYSDDRPDAWDTPGADYYDSRWTIPLAWFYFFRPEDIRLVPVHYLGSSRHEVGLAADKARALALFDRRRPLLMAVIGPHLAAADLDEFVATVAGRPGRHLLLNPDEVLGGMMGDGPDPERAHAVRIARILADLGDGMGPADAARAATLPYVGDFDPDPGRRWCQILGFTYS